MPDTTPRPTELRLALVCYGGVSLAIYMHGMTKELHKLVVASQAYQADPGRNPFRADDTCRAYWDALADLAAQGRPLTASVDVVAGTSAGGINGVCLAKVLARNGSQDALKSLWIDKGDFKVLLQSPAVGGWRARALVAAARTLRRLRDPGWSPLKGDLMSQLLYDAIKAMDAPASAARTLLDEDQTLDLFVTTTDLYGATTRVATGAGGVAQRETDHAQVLHFRVDATRDDFAGERESTGPLAFAARATSCFPGAFAPVSRESFGTEVGPGRPVDKAAVAARFRNRYGDLPGGGYASDDAWFADGGILDNAPFDHVVRAIGEKRAETEVARRLVYIEPDPGGAPDQKPTPAQARPAPPYGQGVKLGALTVKGSHSFLRELLAIRDMNLRIEAIGTIATAQMAQVARCVEDAWEATRGARKSVKRKPWDIDDLRDVEALAERVYDRAPAFVGAGYDAYQRLKVESAATRLAEALAECFVYPPDSNRASFLTAALTAWARMRLGDRPLDGKAVDRFLGPVDVPYRERRLMFILAGVNEMYADPAGPPRAGLDALKAQAWDLLTEVRQATRDAVAGATGDVVDFLRITEDASFEAPEEFARENDARLLALYDAYRADLDARLKDMKPAMWQAFASVTKRWKVAQRRALLSRFLGFPLWDGLIFPTIALSRLPQFTPLDVAQFSPLTARALATPPGGKLKGVALHHFAAFAKEQWRENDYLWGRLDAAELILRTLVETGAGERAEVPADAAAAAATAGPRLKAALSAILTSEAEIVTAARLTSLRDEVARLPGP